MNIHQIARICHETNKAYCESIGDFSQVPWGSSATWQQLSAINGVKFVLENPDAPASAQHENWMAEKLSEGWVYGPVKDPAKKEHPCLVPYEQLPLEQRLKDYLFRQVVEAFIEAGAINVTAQSQNVAAATGTLSGTAHTNDPFDDYEDSEKEPAPTDPAAPEVQTGRGPDVPF